MTDQNSTPRLQPVIRLFVSSTFNDMRHERNSLQKNVFPRLEQICQLNGFQFQAIDLRWGVSSEAGLDHRTMRICFDELRRAQEISPKPNFLILLGNRYGWRPLPEEISVDEFHTLERAAAQVITTTDQPAAAVLQAWYRRDENAVPPIYLLQSRRQRLPDSKDYTQDAPWTKVQAVLWDIINRVHSPEHLRERFDVEALTESFPPSIVRFQASATEQEIWHGTLGVSDAQEHVLAFFRQIENIVELSEEAQIKEFVDLEPSGSIDKALQTEQERLKAAVRKRLGEANVFETFSARLVPARDSLGRPTVDITTDHLTQFCSDIENRLTQIIQGQIDEYWNKTTQPSTERVTRELKIEQDEHERFGRERGTEASFVGREDELRALIDYVQNDSHWPLVIHGGSGCGKTALMARTVEEIAKIRRPIVRFIGVTPQSSDIHSLIGSLCQELRQQYPRGDQLPSDTKALIEELQEHFQSTSPEQPLILCLEALDQLSDADSGRMLNWIPAGQLPGNMKLIVSCLSGLPEGDPAGQPFAVLMQRQIPTENFVHVSALSEDDASELLFDRWLPQAGRTVNSKQRERIEQCLKSEKGRQPIYLKLLFEEARIWRSYDDVSILGESAPALLIQFFERLSRPENHNALLVERVLGYLVASRYGLAENEILEILFADQVYKAELEKTCKQTCHELPANATRIPIAIWSRLRFDLSPYLTERAAPGANVLTFFHRQVREAVESTYFLTETKLKSSHEQLASLFERTCKDHGNNYLPRKRSIGEVAYHFLNSGNTNHLKEIYSNISYFCSYIKCHNAFILKSDIEALPDSYVDDELRLFIGNASALLAKDPDQGPQLMYKELITNDYRRQAERLAIRPWIRADRIHMKNETEQEALGINPVSSVAMHIQANCVAEKLGIAFIHHATKKIELLGMDDLKPCGVIPLPDQNSRVIKKLLCDSRGGILALVYDSGEMDILKTIFSPSGTILSANRVHSDVCLTGKFGAISVCSWVDGIVYQTPNRNIVRFYIDPSDQIMSSNLTSDSRTLISCYVSNIPHLIWRNNKDYSITFPDKDLSIKTDFRPLAICLSESRLIIATEEGGLLIYQWPDLVIEKKLVCRLPIVSITHTNQNLIFMTDRHGNILSLDHALRLMDIGRCSTDQIDEYPSAIYARGAGAFYVSNHKCVILSYGSTSPRDVMCIEEHGGRCSILTYGKEKGFAVSIDDNAPRTLVQSIVGQQYEFEFGKFKWAWNGDSLIAYTGTSYTVIVDNGLRHNTYEMESEVRAIQCMVSLNAFLVLCSSGKLHFVTLEESFSIPHQSVRSETGTYRIVKCGEYFCIVAYNVLCKPTLGNAYTETVMTLYRLLFLAGCQVKIELIELQHFDNNRYRPIGSLSYHEPSNALYLFREEILERWQLDKPNEHNITSSTTANNYNALQPICSYRNGVYYIDTNNRLQYHPMNSERTPAKLASFRSITFLSSGMENYGFFIEDNQHLFKFALEE